MTARACRVGKATDEEAVRSSRRAADAELGQAGGIEVLALGLLVFVVGSLIVANAWAVIDAKLAVTGAAREGARAYVEAAPADADAAAVRAARESMAGHGRSADRLEVTRDGEPYGRCRRVVVTATYPVPLVSLPFVGGLGSVEVRSQHTEIVDPFAARPGLDAGSRCDP